MASPRPEPCRTRRRAAAVPGRLVALVLVAAAVAGCVYTKAVPVGRDTWRLETDGRGALGAEVASRRVLKDAAALTLRQGFTHFLLDDAPAGPSSLAVPALLYGDTRIVAFGSPVGAGAGAPPGLRTCARPSPSSCCARATPACRRPTTRSPSSAREAPPQASSVRTAWIDSNASSSGWPR